jgi:hypothetical protein
LDREIKHNKVLSRENNQLKERIQELQVRFIEQE